MYIIHQSSVYTVGHTHTRVQYHVVGMQCHRESPRRRGAQRIDPIDVTRYGPVAANGDI